MHLHVQCHAVRLIPTANVYKVARGDRNQMPVVYCPECGGQMLFDASIRSYVCKSCGVLYTREQLAEARERQFRPAEDERAQAKKKRKEVLKWWLSDKKEA